MRDILNFLAISDHLGTAGQPTPEQFAELRAAGYQVVINLAMPDSTNALPDEARLVGKQGMEYVHIPVVWEAPKLADLERFLAAMDRFGGNKVLVHCAMNMRVSCFVLLYRVLRQGVPLDRATETMHQIWQPDPVWSAFIERGLAHYGYRPGRGAQTRGEDHG
jgi:protein tyrosine phosphatase (PTP) superfamily phosphohydrolase (DUF442 family)